jgi:pimeloyl-ACP methyl ester carboxylesterase
MPNISPFSSLYSAGLTIKINNGIIPSTNGNRHITINLRICGLSLGALLAIDFAIRHEEKVDSLVLIGAQYKVPSLLIDFQNLIFRCMPNKVFESMGLSKSSTIKLAHSMRSLDFTLQLNNIRCPVTILCGKKDTANLKASKRLKELLPQATLHIVPNAGHELNKYAPNTIAEILNQ